MKTKLLTLTISCVLAANLYANTGEGINDILDSTLILKQKVKDERDEVKKALTLVFEASTSTKNTIEALRKSNANPLLPSYKDAIQNAITANKAATATFEATDPSDIVEFANFTVQFAEIATSHVNEVLKADIKITEENKTNLRKQITTSNEANQKAKEQKEILNKKIKNRKEITEEIKEKIKIAKTNASKEQLEIFKNLETFIEQSSTASALTEKDNKGNDGVKSLENTLNDIQIKQDSISTDKYLSGLAKTPNKDNKIVDVFKLDSKERQEVVNNIKKSTEDIANTISKQINFNENISFSNSLLTQNRVVLLSYLNNDDLKLARAIKSIEGNYYADSTTANLIKDYQEKTSNLWANAIKSYSNFSDSYQKQNIITLGIDTKIDDFIYGFYTSYTRANFNTKETYLNSKNYSFGTYLNYTNSQNELNLDMSLTKSKNELSTMLNFNGANVNKNGNFDSSSISANIDYGYALKAYDSLYIKPFLGFSYINTQNKAFVENGLLAFKYGSQTYSTLRAKLGTEIRYYNSRGFLYLKPSISKEIYNKFKDIKLNYAGINDNILIKSDAKKRVNFELLSGADIDLNESFSLNINFGTKINKNLKNYIGGAGLRYKF
ncbi:autotransporter domain protein [Campylobacter pinnipediorum subsp. caledonicus]|uniref:autotransporter outer membrane beta-barrel domain-containing protein n=1 Tax=Campylobacter pinnipediorum TaxID=1965231 RepID=UPI00099503BF|nr:autotransporter outer membrane beta-barrel domain-containing protein [Campylobacter pinnipediorum]AQW86138.1 autotransporter domain protein [Campylobacter pinnipediorum subsp. caledonicus]